MAKLRRELVASDTMEYLTWSVTSQILPLNNGMKIKLDSKQGKKPRNQTKTKNGLFWQ